MGLQTTLRTILLADPTVSGLVGGTRIYPKILPQNPTFPAITYQRISRIPVADHLTGPGSLGRPRVQVDVWALTDAAAEALGAAVKARLNGFRGVVAGEGDVGRIALETEGGLFDAELLLHRHSADYFVWHEEV
jgi:Protein of unknown function (DUF3168)